MARKAEIISELAYERFNSLTDDIHNESEMYLLLEISIENNSKHLDDMLNSFEYDYQREKAQKIMLN